MRSQYGSTLGFVKALLKEKHLQLRMRMLVDAPEDLHKEYNLHLKSQQDGVHSMALWAANRANGAWFKTVIAMAEAFHSPERVIRLQLTQPSSSHVFEVGESEIFQDEAKLLLQYAELVMNLMSNRAWSQCHYGLLFPYCLARILSESEATRKKAQAFLQKMADGLLKLEEIAMTTTTKSLTRKLMRDLGTLDWIVTREILIQGVKVDWDPIDPELRSMAYSMAAGPTTTKGVLESTLSTVKDAGDRVAKNKQSMSLLSKWCYAATSPYPDNGGVRQIKLDKEDFFDAARAQNKNQLSQIEKTYAEPGLKSFKEIVPAPTEIVAEIRKAGYHSNKIAAAAAAYVLNDASRDFRNLQKVWSGQTTKSLINGCF